MTPNELKDFLIWCTAINYAVLFLWFGAFVGAHGWMYRLHARWFRIPVETFDAIHYAGMAAYKIGVLFLNVAPLAALYLAA
ncbi:MAG: DUF6868 family protein [Betaproteobacteria bacterium]